MAPFRADIGLESGIDADADADVDANANSVLAPFWQRTTLSSAASSSTSSSSSSSSSAKTANAPQSVAIARDIVNSNFKFVETLWDKFVAFEDAFTIEWIDGQHPESSFQDYARSQIPTPLICGILEAHFTSIHKALSKRTQGLLERLHTHLDITLWKCYFLFGSHTLHSRTTLEVLIRILKVWPEIKSEDLIDRMVSARNQRMRERKNGQRDSLSSFQTYDAKAAEVSVQQHLAARKERQKARLESRIKSSITPASTNVDNRKQGSLEVTPEEENPPLEPSLHTSTIPTSTNEGIQKQGSLGASPAAELSSLQLPLHTSTTPTIHVTQPPLTSPIPSPAAILGQQTPHQHENARDSSTTSIEMPRGSRFSARLQDTDQHEDSITADGFAGYADDDWNNVEDLEGSSFGFGDVDDDITDGIRTPQESEIMGDVENTMQILHFSRAESEQCTAEPRDSLEESIQVQSSHCAETKKSSAESGDSLEESIPVQSSRYAKTEPPFTEPENSLDTSPSIHESHLLKTGLLSTTGQALDVHKPENHTTTIGHYKQPFGSDSTRIELNSVVSNQSSLNTLPVGPNVIIHRKHIAAWKIANTQHLEVIKQWKCMIDHRKMLRDDFVYFLACSPEGSSDTLLLQPLYIRMGPSCTFAEHPAKFSRFNKIIIPLYHSKDIHFTLAYVDVAEKSLYHFDSISDTARFDQVKRHVFPWMASIFALLPGPMTLTATQVACFQQTDGVSCGLIVAAWARAIYESDNIQATLDVEELRADALIRLEGITADIGVKQYSPDNGKHEIVDLVSDEEDNLPEKSDMKAKENGFSITSGRDRAEKDGQYTESLHRSNTVTVNAEDGNKTLHTDDTSAGRSSPQQPSDVLDAIQNLLTQASTLIADYHSAQEREIHDFTKSIEFDEAFESNITTELFTLSTSVKRVLETYFSLSETSRVKRQKLGSMETYLSTFLASKPDNIDNDDLQPIINSQNVTLQSLKEGLATIEQDVEEISKQVRDTQKLVLDKEISLNTTRNEIILKRDRVTTLTEVVDDLRGPMTDIQKALDSYGAFWVRRSAGERMKEEGRRKGENKREDE